MNTSSSRTDSWIRTEVSPFENLRIEHAVRVTPMLNRSYLTQRVTVRHCEVLEQVFVSQEQISDTILCEC